VNNSFQFWKFASQRGMARREVTVLLPQDKKYLASDSDSAASSPSDEEKILNNPRRNLSALVVVGAAALLMIAGVSYQCIEARADARRFPMQGIKVDVGGYGLNINCTGQGSPTVILESGLSVPALGWRSVQPYIAKFTRVCSYDRAGYGWSDDGPLPQTSVQSVKELHTLLANAGENPPFVLVGHSFGGTNIRIYNQLYPGDVAGMVLADCASEDLKFPESVIKLIDADTRRRQRDRKWARLLSPLGVTRFLARGAIDDPASSQDEREWAYITTQTKFINATASEKENLQNGREALKAAGTLADKPLIVLIAAKSMLDIPLSPQGQLELQKVWEEREKQLAHLSSRGKWILVPGSSHMMNSDRPDAIVSATREVWAEAKLP
jgi:pimeloyl-ACP methyl ester carboxylesterase